MFCDGIYENCLVLCSEAIVRERVDASWILTFLKNGSAKPDQTMQASCLLTYLLPIAVPVPALPLSTERHLPCLCPIPPNPYSTLVLLLPFFIFSPTYDLPARTPAPICRAPASESRPKLARRHVSHHSCSTTMSTTPSIPNSSISGPQNNLLARSRSSQSSRPPPNPRVSWFINNVTKPCSVK